MERTRRVRRYHVQCLHEVLGAYCALLGVVGAPSGKKEQTLSPEGNRQGPSSTRYTQSSSIIVLRNHSIEWLPFTNTPFDSELFPFYNRLRIDHRVKKNNPPQWQPTTVQVSRMMATLLSQLCTDYGKLLHQWSSVRPLRLFYPLPQEQ